MKKPLVITEPFEGEVKVKPGLVPFEDIVREIRRKTIEEVRRNPELLKVNHEEQSSKAPTNPKS